MQHWPKDAPPELVEMLNDSRRRAVRAKKLEAWEDGEWGKRDGIRALYDMVSEKPVRLPVAFDTGIAGLNALLGYGFPTGITEMYGAASVGKSSLAYQLIAAAQASGKRAVLCATQRPHVPLMERLGVNTKELCLLRSWRLEDMVAAVMEDLAALDDLFLVVDTATALRPDFRHLWQWHMGKFLPDLANALSARSAAVIVNELRARRSVDPAKMFAGGTDSAAIRLAAMFPTRLELLRDSVTEEEYSLVVHTVASPNRPPGQYVTLPARKGCGVDVVRSLLETAAGMNVVHLEGPWVYFWKAKLGRGFRGAADYLRSDEGASTLSQLYARVQGLVSGVEQVL